MTELDGREQSDLSASQYESHPASATRLAPIRCQASGGAHFAQPTRMRRAPLLIGSLVALAAVGALVAGIWGVVIPVLTADTATETAYDEPAVLIDDELTAVISYNLASTPISTPIEQWTAGVMPYLFQTDPAWADEPYAGGTVAENGCGPTALTMVYVYLTGDTSYTPASMSAFADENNYAPTGATEWAFMTDGAAQLGISGWQVNPNRASVTSELEAGHPVILSMRPGTFTTVGHFIVLTGIDENGQVTVHDPNSLLNSVRTWGITELLNQASMAWAFSA